LIAVRVASLVCFCSRWVCICICWVIWFWFRKAGVGVIIIIVRRLFSLVNGGFVGRGSIVVNLVKEPGSVKVGRDGSDAVIVVSGRTSGP
jgi:hypothetical protein